MVMEGARSTSANMNTRPRSWTNPLPLLLCIQTYYRVFRPTEPPVFIYNPIQDSLDGLPEPAPMWNQHDWSPSRWTIARSPEVPAHPIGLPQQVIRHRLFQKLPDWSTTCTLGSSCVSGCHVMDGVRVGDCFLDTWGLSRNMART